jgi:hypothetical protein
LFTNLTRYKYNNEKEDFYDSELNGDYSESGSEFSESKQNKHQQISFDKFV